MNRLIVILVWFLIINGCAPPAVAFDTDATARRIVSLGPINTENVYLLDAQERLIANTIYCVNPPAAEHKKKIGTLLQANIEEIISLRPDLVLATSLTRPRQIAKLRSLGINVVQFTQPAGFDEIAEQFIELGQLLDRKEKARQIVSQARLGIEAIQRKVAGYPKEKVFLQVGVKPLFSSVENSFTNDFITFGGGENIAAGASQGVYSREKVVAQDPAVIIIAIMGSEGVTGEKEKANWRRYPSISAVKNNRIHIVDPNLVCSPSPSSFVKALSTVASLIHPDVSNHE